MKYEIVEFRNNKFGIKRRDFFENLFNYGGDFLDVKSFPFENYFWSSKSGFFIDCQTSDLTKLFEWVNEDYNSVIKKLKLCNT